MELDVFACERLERCTWQGFALSQGIGRGLLVNSLHQWQEAHAERCGGRLIQLKATEQPASERG